MKRILFLSPLFILCLILAAGSAFALPPDQPLQPDLQASLLSQGWQRITDGVLQRSLGGNKVETFAFGREGFEWMLQSMEDRLGFLLGEYDKYPSDHLRQVILDLRKEVAETRKSLETAPRSMTSELGAGEPVGGEALENCDIQYGAHADAYPLIPGPGVGAAADSYFRNNCFYWGKAQASVYVRATVNGITTSDSATQTQEGENVSAAVALTRNGVEDCYSDAWAKASSDGLGISYETYDWNDDCPVPTLDIVISGPTSTFISGYNCRTLTWTASVTGGLPPYSAISWYRDGYYTGSGSSLSMTFCGDNWNWTEYVNLRATVSDSLSTSDFDDHTTTIRYTSTTTCYPYKICPVEEL